MGMEKWFGKKKVTAEVSPSVPPHVQKIPEVTTNDLGLNPDGTLETKTPERIEAEAWAERDREAADIRHMNDEVTVVMDSFREKLTPLFIQLDTPNPEKTYAGSDDARGLLNELVDDLRDVAKKHEIYTNPRENPEAFKNQQGFTSIPSDNSQKLEEFKRTVRHQIAEFVKSDVNFRDFSSVSEKKSNEVVDPYKKPQEGEYRDTLAKESDLTLKLEEEIFYKIFKDPRS